MIKQSALFICTLIAIALLSGAAGIAKEKPSGEIKPGDTLIELKEEADIGTDVKFSALLDSQGLRSDLHGPGKMRAFLAALPIVKTGMGVGYIYAIRRVSFIWSTGDCILLGTREQAMQRILAAVKTVDLRESEVKKDGSPALHYTVEEAGMLHTVAIARPEDRIINGRPVSTTKIVWKVEDGNISSMADLSRLFSVYPFLKDRRIDETVYAMLGPVQVEMLTMGGPSRKAYDWDIVLVPLEKKEKVSFFSQVEGMFEKLGYTKEGADAAKNVFSRKSTGSTVYLDKIPGGENVHMRFVPER
jgi:hypothetical protein